MAYERFYVALNRYEAAIERYLHAEDIEHDVYREMLVDFAAELFDALFDHYPWGRGTRRFEEGKRQIEKEVEGEIDEVDADEMETDDRLREAKLRWEIDGQIRDKEKRERYETVFIGSLNIIAGHPDPLPPSDMLDRLRGLQLPYTSYVPDEDEPSQDLIAAAYVRGATLFTTWLLSGYGDDIQPMHRELENLLVRLNSVRLDSINPLDQTRSLSRRVGAELAFQRGDYSEALTGMANSISPLYDDEIDDAPPDLNDPQFAPWLSDVEVRATECIEAIEHDDNVDWPVVVRACELLSRCFFDVSEYVGLRTFDEDLDTQHAFWNERSGWARAKLTPDRLRNLLKQQDDESAAQRVETYFFADGRWERLPERAQRALVTADRMLISSSRGRYALVANEIRIATEEMLYYYLWLPLSEWIGAQRQPHPGWRTILGRPKEGRRSPSIDDYVSLLWHSPIKDYFQTLGMSDDDVRFLTKDNRTTKHLQTLRDTRNAAEHEPGDTVDPQTVRQLYAESLGIGRRGVLPELVRLLAKD